MSSALALLCALSGDVYTFADEIGSTVSHDGLHVRATLAKSGEVYAGLGIGFDGPLDASGAEGLVFEARRGRDGTPYVRVQVPDRNTDPDAGVCTDCYNDFGIQFEVGEEWTRYEVRFADLVQEGGWGAPRPPAVDASALYGVQLKTAVPGATLDLEIRGLALMGCESTGRTGLGIEASRPRHAEQIATGEGFSFHGFLRIPMRIGANGSRLHSPPQIPDGSYTDWRYTNVAGGPWTELWMSYGRGRATANVVIAAYDVTDASYRDLLSQLGIDQAFLSFDVGDAFGDRGGLVWNVGAFSSRYGAAGRYDAGAYDTYLFGATHVAGETVSAWYRLRPGLTLAVDHGVGAKLAVTPLVPGLEAPFLPYAGDEQQGSTLLHHAHVGLGIGSELTVALHYLSAWTSDALGAGAQDGRITSFGVEAKLVESAFGDAYLGIARLDSFRPLRVAGALEVLHSFEGWNLRDNFFGAASDGTGTVDTLLFQYTWGEEERLELSAFGMFNRISNGTNRLKVGAEGKYALRDWLAVDLRYDVVEPDLDDPDVAFHVISPSVIFRGSLASNEEVWLGYSGYVLGSAVAPGYPHETLEPDPHLIRLMAQMWW